MSRLWLGLRFATILVKVFSLFAIFLDNFVNGNESSGENPL